MMWLVAGGFVILFALLGLVFAAFWAEWPPLDDTPLPEAKPTGPPAEEWMWSPGAVHRAKHRREDIGQGTIRLPWYDIPTGPQPLYPPRDQVE